MRLAFMGSPAFAAPSLAGLVAAGHEIACVYSQPPRPSGRGQALTPTPVHAFAERLGLPVRTPKSLKGADEQAAFAALDLDVAVVVAYGLILPKPILEAPRRGCLNLHGSLLPRWRGAAPIQRAIEAGDALTGVQVMQMEEGLDTGPVLLSETLRIFPFETGASLHDRMAQAGAALLPVALAGLERASLTAQPQAADGVTYARKIEKADLRIDWTRPAEAVDRQIRAFAPSPGAWFELEGPKGPVRVKALMSRTEEGAGAPGEALDDALLIACGAGAVRLLTLQREGKPAMEADAFLRGTPLPKGARLL
jgi:methionyl-tRNA formyltransferase